MIGLKLADELELFTTFETGEHARRECANRILAHAQLELCVNAPFPDSDRLDDLRIEHERRRRVTFAKWPKALQVLDRRDSERPAEGNVDLHFSWFGICRALRRVKKGRTKGVEVALQE